MVLSVIPDDGHPYLEIQWKLSDTEVEAVFLSNLVEFRGLRAIRLGIQNLKDQRCTLNLFAHHIRHTGVELKAVICRVDGLEWIDMIQHGCQSTALFTAILAKTLQGPQTLTFRVFIANTVCNYRFLLRDCTLKHHLWSAASKNSGTTDMDFKIQNRIFPAHKSLVIARSKTFSAELERLEELTDEGCTNSRPRIALDLNPDTFEALLKYMYTGEFQVPMKNMEEFWKSVATYGLATLSQLGEVVLQGSLKPTDWIELLGSLEVTRREHQLPTGYKMMNLTIFPHISDKFLFVDSRLKCLRLVIPVSCCVLLTACRTNRKAISSSWKRLGLAGATLRVWTKTTKFPIFIFASLVALTVTAISTFVTLFFEAKMM